MLLFARAKAWMAEARGERREDPERCLFAAVLAASFAGSLKPEEHPEDEVANLRTETWTEVANARRLIGDFESAEGAFHRAAAAAKWMAPLLESAEAAAHFLIASRRLAEAEDLLVFLQGIRERRGERHEAGRICLERGIVARHRQDESAALHLFLRSLQLLELANHPALALAAFHNTIDSTARLGHFETALAWLDRCASMYEESGDEIDLLRRRWVEARIQDGLGNLPCADAYLRAVREEFEDHNLFYQASLVTLDLCAVWIRRGKFREVACGVDEAVSTFQALKIRREALAGLLLLQEAARAEQATVAMVQAAGAALRAEGR
jgi:tetratricopeptide (TPR) repeat protein